MSDPFEALRAPLTPIDPDPAFAAALRARLARALSPPRGVSMSTTDVRLPAEPAAATATTGMITPYLAVADARRALEFYAAAFGARPSGEPIVMPDGRIGHAEILVAGARVMLSDAHPEIGVVAPEPGAGATVSLHTEVADVDAVTAAAVAEGATLEREPSDSPYGRIAVVRDPFGHRWMLNTPPRPADRVRQGDVVYASLLVPDVDRGAAFFGAVLGWTYAPGSAPQGRQVVGPTPHHGLWGGQWGGQQRSTLLLCYAVDDIADAVQRVRAAGGQAEEPDDRPYGVLSDCLDDQGTAFSLVQLPVGESSPRGPVNGARHGDLSYLTLEVVDSARARAFYGAVLGWTFTSGHVADGWQTEDVVPMTGMHGGHHQATVVPMYRVDDIAGAVELVRSGGGTASEPSREPYGLMADCVDDQGTRFYLGEH